MLDITKGTINELLESNPAIAVTIYLPTLTTASPPHISENQIRLKNLTAKACDQLRDSDRAYDVLANQLSEFAEKCQDDMEFWKSQTKGLLICAEPGSIKTLHLPIDTEEYIAVDNQYHLAPILGLINDARDYYVLLLAQHNPQLLQGNMYGLCESGIKLPANIREALGIDEPNFKTENQGSARGSSLNTSWFNGRGGSRNPQEEDRLRFFRLIDKTLHDNTDRSLPLILAGIDAEIAEYRGISKYPHIMSGSISGNYINASISEIEEKAKQIIWQEIVIPEHQAITNEYQGLRGASPDKVAHDKKTILAAAEQGRIDKLLTSTLRTTTDTVQDRAESVLRISFPDFSTSQMLNNLALKVWRMSGKVIGLSPSQMPDGATMVASLRY
jgi:hypothetical protein